MMVLSDSHSKPRSLLALFALAILLIWSVWSFFSALSPTTLLLTEPQEEEKEKEETPARSDPTTFYDNPEMSYTMDAPVRNWDLKRRQWLSLNPSFTRHGMGSVLMVTGSQPGPCKNPVGDHLLLRLFKNKVDYCRIHGCDVYYNNVLLDPKMFGYWAKYPVVKAAMLAHPEAEWIWWVDSDAVITDMDFEMPLERYKEHNLVVHGWEDAVYVKHMWTGLNAGVFLLRNCQWSMDFLERWVSLGPSSPDYEKWGPTLKSMFTDKTYPESDDQTGLAYLMATETQKWGDKFYLENEYDLNGYWIAVIDTFERVDEHYKELERRMRKLRRRHAEKGGENYRAEWEAYVSGGKLGSTRRSFITHFTGCQQCNGEHNPMYKGEQCWEGMAKALNFADNQVLRNYGYIHPHLRNSSYVEPRSF